METIFRRRFGVDSIRRRTMAFQTFLTLEDHTEVIYFVSESFSPEHEKTLIWNDKEIGIKWPVKPIVISDKDKNNPSFDESFHIV